MKRIYTTPEITLIKEIKMRGLICASLSETELPSSDYYDSEIEL